MTPQKARLAILTMALIFATSSPCDDMSHRLEGATLGYALPQGDSPRATFTRNLACYIFDGVVGEHITDCSSNKDGVVDISQLPQAAAEGLFETLEGESKLVNTAKIRTWWNTWSYPLRAQRRQLALVPNELAIFERLTKFKTWPTEIIPLSHVKNKTRVIYRPTKGGLSVSQTLDSETGDADSRVLETEIAIERGDQSGNFDFYAYNESGQLTTTAKFPAGERTVPGVCMSCHYSQSSGRFERSGK